MLALGEFVGDVLLDPGIPRADRAGGEGLEVVDQFLVDLENFQTTFLPMRAPAASSSRPDRLRCS